MASVDRYDSLGEEDDYDELDNSGRHYNYPENYNYFHNSPRDLTLNLPKTTTNSFKSYQPIYDSPESDDVSLSRYLSVSVSLVSLITENLLSRKFRQLVVVLTRPLAAAWRHLSNSSNDFHHFRSVYRSSSPMPGPPQLEKVPLRARDFGASHRAPASTAGNHDAMEGLRKLATGSGNVVGR